MKQKSWLKYIIFLASFSFAVLLLGVRPAHAYNNNRIIDDAVFDNAGSMSEGDIQNLLNSFPNSCLKNYQAPYPNDYFNYGGNVPAARVIKRAADLWGISPKVILVTLEKEESLVRGNAGCDGWRYNSAMGMGCPDGGACPAPGYEGFSKQVTKGSWQLKFSKERSYGNIPWDGDDNVTYYGYMTRGNRKRCASCSTIYYDGYISIDNTSVYLENGATAALYTYTPHFGGNTNFFNLFNAWFGSTYSNGIAVIKVDGDNRLYLSTGGNYKHYIPSIEIYNAWGINALPVQTVSQTYFDSIPEREALSLMQRIGTGIYLMDNGKKHYAPSLESIYIWGYDPGAIPTVADYVGMYIPDAEWLGRFARSTDSNDTRVWMMDGSTKHYVPSVAVLNNWLSADSQIMPISPALLDSKVTGSNLGNYFQVGSTKYQLASAQPYKFDNDNIAYDWGGSGANFNTIISSQLNYLLAAVSAKQLIRIDNDPRVWFIENNTVHYIPDMDSLDNAGFASSGGISSIKLSIFNTFSVGSNFSYIVRETGTNKIYVLDGNKHYLPSSDLLNAWSDGSTIPTYSAQSLGSISNGIDASTIVRASGNVYVFTLNHGRRLYIPTPSVLQSWGYNNPWQLTDLNRSLLDKLPYDGWVWSYVSNGANKYMINDSKLYIVASDGLASQWGLGGSVAVDTSTIARFNNGGSLKQHLKLNGSYYLIDGGSKIALGGLVGDYGVDDTNSTTLTQDTINLRTSASYLAKASNNSDLRVFLISQGKKYHITDYSQLLAYGYNTNGIAITFMDASELSGIPLDAGQAPIFVKKALDVTPFIIENGGRRSFADDATKTAWGVNDSNVGVLSDYIFNSMPQRNAITRLARDSYGRIFFIENGTKRWILSASTYFGTYASNYLPTQVANTTLDLIPSGANIP